LWGAINRAPQFFRIIISAALVLIRRNHGVVIKIMNGEVSVEAEARAKRKAEKRRAEKATVPSSHPNPYGKKLWFGAFSAIATIAIIVVLAVNSGKGFTEKQYGIRMTLVRGGTFIMGCTLVQRGEYCSKDVHYVTLSDFYIGKYEVTQKQWKAVMGKDNNPSEFIGDNLPVDSVSWNDAQEFIGRLNASTGGNYRLPTEAEWEYAARGGSRSRGYTFSGSDTAGDVGWYDSNPGGQETSPFNRLEKETHSVGTKKANEIGLYDMSGNVSEWVNDLFDRYIIRPQTNPRGAVEGEKRVHRGGSWKSADLSQQVEARGTDTAESFELLVWLRRASSPDERDGNIGFRLAYDSEYMLAKREAEERAAAEEMANKAVENNVFAAEKYGIEMAPVRGGTLKIGCTPKQQRDCETIGSIGDRPAYHVTLSDFYIGKHPVTQGQWMAVMGNNPAYFTGGDSLPVENVSLRDIRKFMMILNDRTSGNYRLPTEDEWEYAARGGNQSRGYKYSGSDDIEEVAWYGSNSGNRPHPVGTKKANELGIYDMSGNVSELVDDVYVYLSPIVLEFSTLRGGSWESEAKDVRVSSRDFGTPDERDSNTGFRLAHSLE